MHNTVNSFVRFAYRGHRTRETTVKRAAAVVCSATTTEFTETRGRLITATVAFFFINFFFIIIKLILLVYAAHWRHNIPCVLRYRVARTFDVSKTIKRL